MMSKLYAVTKGEYSDYHICALTSNREVAERLADRYSADVEEYPDGLEHINKSVFEVRIMGNGETKAICQTTNDYSFRAAQDQFVWTFDFGRGKQTFCFADSAEQAIKIARDRIAKTKAEELGL